MKFEEYYKARDIIEDFLIKDFRGPVEDKEIIEEFPSQYYSMGILFPQDIKLDPIAEIPDRETYIKTKEILDDNNSGDAFKDMDEGLSLANMYKPSSIAISTKLRSGIRDLRITINYGKYILLENNTIDIEETNIRNALSKKVENEEEKKSKVFIKDKWKRMQFKKEKQVAIADKNKTTIEIEEGLDVEIYTHLIDDDNSKNITIALINKNKSKKDWKIDDGNSYFQVSMKIEPINQDDNIFLPKKILSGIKEDEETQEFSMLYNHIDNYASGHGCAVEELVNEFGCYRMTSKIMPSFNLKQMEASIRTNPKIFEMQTLSTLNKPDLIELLSGLKYSYENWIDEQKISAEDLDLRYEESGKRNLDMCLESIDRISKGIRLLEDDNVFKSFQFTNKAMLKQRVDYLERENKSYNIDDIKWYPFQLAFLLQEIESIVKPEGKYREIVDLLWFPTGGGKTEAYLGVSAFCIFYRRLLYGESGEGVSIIMRYTLRLLTIQQFERAAALICACESLRKEYNLGGSKISIGLFVGSGMTPNYMSDAIEKLEKIKISGIKSVYEGNPIQLLKCPVCGTKLTPEQYQIKNNSMKINCANQECEFYKGLPIYLIDEDIYECKPTLILSTVDKFARMTWEPGIGKIFGIDTPYRSPELIIQDELHLISGPLGTITGLYETAVDFFCMENEVKTKIIGSTATIKHAASQINSLYGREHRQFPPQGINIRDSYYANEVSPEIKPDRKYIGILSSHKTPTTTLVRLYACLQFATRYLQDLGFTEEVIDNYWTNIGYFNTLRELGGAVVQVYDNVQERYRFLKDTKFKNLEPRFTGKKRYDNLMELTSRKKQSDITKALDDLNLTYTNKGAYDYVLASNMISVGIDFPRLGLMSIAGQPKSNSEYIQASSRVGRENPGLVFVVYNPSRSRDRSHFEQFYEYHSSIYKYVEANSLTPFSSRARERALSSIYISMCRQSIKELRDKIDAKNFDLNDIRLEKIENFIRKRAREIIGKEDLNNLLIELDEIKLEWSKATQYNNLRYDEYSGDDTFPLLKTVEEKAGVFLTLNSMRNVDFQSNIYLEEE